MELREEVEAAATKEEVESLLAVNLERRREYADQLRDAYLDGEWSRMAHLVHELTYFHRIQHTLLEKL
jgi:hypothetical protein